MASGMKIKWDLTKIFTQFSMMKKANTTSATRFVQFQAKSLVRALAFHTPIAPMTVEIPVKARDGKRRYYPGVPMERVKVDPGRARSGWWPTAIKLGVTSVYSKFPNKGEGDVVDQSQSIRNPHIIMTNTVPYILRIKGHGQWAEAALNQERTRLPQKLFGEYQKGFAAWL